MKDKLLQLLHKNTGMIDTINKVIYYFRVQNYDSALRLSEQFLHILDMNMELLLEVAGQERIQILSAMLSELLEAQKAKDYVLQADLSELKLKKFFTDLQEDIVTNDGFFLDDTIYQNNYEAIKRVDPVISELIYSGTSPFDLTSRGYETEYTSTGQMTLALSDNLGRYYLHSNCAASEEAFALASSWYQEEVSGYIIYGYGFGYHIMELLQLDSNIRIEVFEADINILKLAATYTWMSEYIHKPSLKTIYDPDHTLLLQRIKNMKEDERFFIHYPSLRHIQNKIIKEKLENYFVHYSSIANQLKLLNANFRDNISNYDGLVDEIKEQFHNKDLYIIAAGPSLDKNFRILKDINREKGMILATGTVFRKLIVDGIRPDYMMVIDANERVYSQIAGIEHSVVPMLFLSTAYKGFAKAYKSKKYMICQKGYRKAEEFAAEHGTMLIQTGGSVSTTALDLGIAFGCRRIIFLGLDLAYTDNFVHASETSLRELNKTEDLRKVQDVFGNKIYTSRALDMFRNWIENRIRGIEGIEFIDATEGGAKIEGMKVMKLSDCINS